MKYNEMESVGYRFSGFEILRSERFGKSLTWFHVVLVVMEKF